MESGHSSLPSLYFRRHVYAVLVSKYEYSNSYRYSLLGLISINWAQRRDTEIKSGITVKQLEILEHDHVCAKRTEPDRNQCLQKLITLRHEDHQ